MGLDVYLYKCADREAAKRNAELFEEAFEKMRNEKFGGQWGHQLEGEQRAQWEAERAKLAEQFGTDEWGSSKAEEKVEIDSTIDAEHYFKIGYFRSSYNDGGINRVMSVRGLPTLGDIFDVGDDYEIVPDWHASLSRCNQAIAGFEKYLTTDESRYQVIEARPNMFVGADKLANNEQDALRRFMEVRKREHAPDFRSFGNSDGDFWLDGIKVVACIAGTTMGILSHRMEPVHYLIIERKADESLDWYLTALKIVRETIEYVLAQPNPGHFYMHWSG